MNDPMLSPDAKDRGDYELSVHKLMLETIEQDRAERRMPLNEQPATIIGSVGVPSGLNQAVR